MYAKLNTNLAISIKIHYPTLRHNKFNRDSFIEGHPHDFIREKSEKKLYYERFSFKKYNLLGRKNTYFLVGS